MGFETISIITLLLCILGIIVIILRHLPDAVNQQQQEKEAEPVQNLEQKGLEVSEPSRFKTTFKFWMKRLWNFFLEAKDVRPGNKVGNRLKKILRRTKPLEPAPIIPPSSNFRESREIYDESYYLDKIKADPRNLSNYKDLGNYYLDEKSFAEAKDVFVYLSKHVSGDAGIYAKLGYIYFQLRSFELAIESYEKSLALDSTQPNRYYNLGLAYEASGNSAKAREFVEKSLSIEPGNQKYKDTLLRITSKRVKN